MKHIKRFLFRAARRVLGTWGKEINPALHDTVAAEIADEFLKFGMSIGMREAYEEALKRNAKLRADDSRFNGCVKIIHEDGSIMFFHYAFLESWGEYLLCFTEHNGVHAFPKADLESWAEFDRTRVGDQYDDSEWTDTKTNPGT